MASRRPRPYQRGYPSATPRAWVEKALKATKRATHALWDAVGYVETAEEEAMERDFPRRPVNKMATASDKLRDLTNRIIDLEDYLMEIDVLGD